MLEFKRASVSFNSILNIPIYSKRRFQNGILRDANVIDILNLLLQNTGINLNAWGKVESFKSDT